MVYSEIKRRNVFEDAWEATISSQFVEGGRYYIYVPISEVKDNDYSEAIQKLLPILKNGWRIELGEMQSDDPSKPKVYFVTHRR